MARGEDLPPREQYQRRQADPVLNLRSRNHINDRQYLAAVDIRTAMEGLTSQSIASSLDSVKLILGGVSGRSSAGIPRWQLLHQVRKYRRWAVVVVSRQARKDSARTWFWVADRVLFHGDTPTALDGREHWRKGTALNVLRRALDLF